MENGLWHNQTGGTYLAESHRIPPNGVASRRRDILGLLLTIGAGDKPSRSALAGEHRAKD